jgi:hypothetical protein
MTRLPTPAWMAMMPMLWAIMSCNSRAMRSRSAVIACWVACACRAAAACRFCRIDRPISQATTTAGNCSCARALSGRSVGPAS